MLHDKSAVPMTPSSLRTNNANRIFNRQALHPAAFDDLNVAEIAQEVPQNVDGVRAVVDEYATAADRGVRVPTVPHVDVRRKRVFDEYDFADRPFADEFASFRTSAT